MQSLTRCYSWMVCMVPGKCWEDTQQVGIKHMRRSISRAHGRPGWPYQGSSGSLAGMHSNFGVNGLRKGVEEVP